MQFLPLRAPSSTAAFKFGLILVIALMAANCATAAPVALGTPLEQALTAVDPSLVSKHKQHQLLLPSSSLLCVQHAIAMRDPLH